MVEQRKYLPQELDYVLSRVAAGWKFDIIAKAFKQDFASHWSDRIFTKKQVQYIKNTYKRPPGIIKPYDGPIPDFSISPPATLQDHTADLQATIDTALNMDLYGAREFSDGQQMINNMNGYSAASAWPSMTEIGTQSQQYVAGGSKGIINYEAQHNLNSSNQSASLRPNNFDSAGPHAMEGTIDPVLRSLAQGLDHGMANTHQHNSLVGVGTQFPQWTPTAPASLNHTKFSGYASRLDTDPSLAIPSLDDTLLNSVAAGRVLSGEHADQLIREPLHHLQYNAYGEPPAADFDSARGKIPQTGFTEPQRGDTPEMSVQAPMGCSLETATRTDRSGWWYATLHDGWCRIPHEHRHDYDGGVHFRSYDRYTQNIYTEQNDHVTGYLLGLCSQLHGRHPEGEAVCLHQDCEEARRVAQELVDASLPSDHELRRAALSQPPPAVIRLLSSLSDRLPEGFAYNPFTERVVRFDVPNLDLPLLFGDELANQVDHDAQQIGPQQARPQQARPQQNLEGPGQQKNIGLETA